MWANLQNTLAKEILNSVRCQQLSETTKLKSFFYWLWQDLFPLVEMVLLSVFWSSFQKTYYFRWHFFVRFAFSFWICLCGVKNWDFYLTATKLKSFFYGLWQDLFQLVEMLLLSVFWSFFWKTYYFRWHYSLRFAVSFWICLVLD